MKPYLVVVQALEDESFLSQLALALDRDFKCKKVTSLAEGLETLKLVRPDRLILFLNDCKIDLQERVTEIASRNFTIVICGRESEWAKRFTADGLRIRVLFRETLNESLLWNAISR